MFEQIERFDPRDGGEIGEVLDAIEEVAADNMIVALRLAARVLERIREEYRVELVTETSELTRWRTTDTIPTYRSAPEAPYVEVRDGSAVVVISPTAPQWGVEVWDAQQGYTETDELCTWEACGVVRCAAWDGDEVGFQAVLRTAEGWWQVSPW